MKTALIIIDVQNDFLPEGALPVPEGRDIIPIINQLLTYPFHLIAASKDWHPEAHCSFASTHSGKEKSIQGVDHILWPTHCVANSYGSEFPKELHAEKVEAVFYKGTDRSIDSYSAFFDNDHSESTGLEKLLKQKQVEVLFFAGLATEYCVKYSVLDALKIGFEVFVIKDACQGINSHHISAAFNEMEKAGALMITSHFFQG